MEQRATLREIEQEISEASMGGPFDVRRVLRLEGAAQRAWAEARAAWVSERLAGDPRIDFSD